MALIGNSVYTGNAVEVQGSAFIGTQSINDAVTQYYDWTAWTPASATETLNTNNCLYMQIGNEVLVNCNITIDAFAGPVQTTTVLTGLPQSADAASAYTTFRMTVSDAAEPMCEVSFSGTSMTFTRCANVDFAAGETYTFNFQASYKLA